MARYGRHLLRSREGSQRTAWCNEPIYSDRDTVSSPDFGDACPKCSSKYWIDHFKQNPDFPYHLGSRLDLKDDPRCNTYKSIYEIRDKSEMVWGFVVTRLGFGQGWTVRACDTEIAHEPGLSLCVMSKKDVRYKREPTDIAEFGGAFASKEHALSAVPLLVSEGKLQSSETVLAKARAKAEAGRKRAAAYEESSRKAAEERAAALTLIREEFINLRRINSITERQRRALDHAVRLLGLDAKETLAGRQTDGD